MCSNPIHTLLDPLKRLEIPPFPRCETRQTLTGSRRDRDHREALQRAAAPDQEQTALSRFSHGMRSRDLASNAMPCALLGPG